MAAVRLGMIGNPIAGMGGAGGLKGSDTPEIVARARELGATPKSPLRAGEALAAIAAGNADIEIVAAPGEMCEAEARAAGFEPRIVGGRTGIDTNAEDSVRIALEMANLPVDLLLFAGGDGTARDMVRAIGDCIPVVGIPSGVKMHSAIYATNPRTAARMVLRYRQGGVPVRELEVMDIDEAAFREGAVSAKLYGYLKVPLLPDLIQGTKVSGVSSDRTALKGIAARIVEKMMPGRLYILGPGTTMRAVADRLGIKKTLLGVDLIRDGTPIVLDASEKQILAVLDGGATIAVTPIGGQGHVFGRGNQQISARVISRVGIEHITVAATVEKIASLRDNLLRVDTGDADLDSNLCGWRRVITGYKTDAVCRVSF